MGGSECPELLYTGIPAPSSLHTLPPLLSQAIVQAIGAMQQLDEDTLHKALQELAEAVGDMSKALKQMHGNRSLQLGSSPRPPIAVHALARVHQPKCARAWPIKHLGRDSAGGGGRTQGTSGLLG